MVCAIIARSVSDDAIQKRWKRAGLLRVARNDVADGLRSMRPGIIAFVLWVGQLFQIGLVLLRQGGGDGAVRRENAFDEAGRERSRIGNASEYTTDTANFVYGLCFRLCNPVHEVTGRFIAGAGEPFEHIGQRFLICGFVLAAPLQSLPSTYLGARKFRVQTLDAFQRLVTQLAFRNHFAEIGQEGSKFVL